MPCCDAMRVSSSGLGSAACGSVRPTALDEGLEAGRGGGHEPAGAAIADTQGVRDAARREDALAGTQDVRLVARPQRELALEDVEALVVVVVDVQRRVVAGGAGRLEQGEGTVGLLGGDVDVDAVVQEPDVGHERGPPGPV